MLNRRSVLLAGAALPLAAHAQHDYPNRPIKMVVPYVAGGGIDTFARPFARKLGDLLGQLVIIENRGGVAGLLGSVAVAKAAPDGYTLLCHAGALYLAPLVTKSLPLDPIKDFTPIVRAVVTPVALVVHSTLPVHDMKEFLDYARKKPDGLDYVTAGAGSQQNLAGEAIAEQNGIKLTHVAYKGGNQAVADLVGGQVKVGILQLSTVLPFIHAGKLRVLGLVENHRSANFPEIPTLAENGLPGYSMIDTFIALYGPAGLPPAIARRINLEAHKAMEAPEVLSAIKSVGYEPSLTSTPEEFTAIGAETYARFQQMLSVIKLTVD